MRALDTFSKRLSQAFAVIASLTIAVIMVMTVADVLRRALTGRSIPGTTEFSEVFLVAAAFLGLAYAMRTGAHVAVDLLLAKLPPRAARITYAAGLSIAICVLVWMTWQTAGTALHSISVNEYRYGLIQVPVWPAKAVVPIALTALVLECVVALGKGTPPAANEGRDG